MVENGCLDGFKKDEVIFYVLSTVENEVVVVVVVVVVMFYEIFVLDVVVTVIWEYSSNTTGEGGVEKREIKRRGTLM